jgi:NhaA family Na+:H+ antiporter
VRRGGAAHPGVYIPLGGAAWYCAFQAGIHPTLAGVALGLLTPAGPLRGRDVLGQLEHRLHPWSSYLVIPIFALANAGVSLGGGALERAFTSRVTWAVIVGFVVGKTAGIAGTALLGIRVRLGLTPAGVGTRHLVGTGALGGIGFTVALFIASLAFQNEMLQVEAKVGILGGSLLSGALGALVLVAGRTWRARAMSPR